MILFPMGGFSSSRFDDGQLLGDGVNIAARLENICEPGGIILSDDAYRQVRDRLDDSWEDGGEHKVKNTARPIQVWHCPSSDNLLISQIAFTFQLIEVCSRH
jgi:class 3 adenylate cyclase